MNKNNNKKHIVIIIKKYKRFSFAIRFFFFTIYIIPYKINKYNLEKKKSILKYI